MKKILVLGGHLDDSILAVGGILRKCVDSGGSVSVMCFGNGDEAFTTLADRDTCVERFKAEAVKAHKILGVDDFECLDEVKWSVWWRMTPVIPKHTYNSLIGSAVTRGFDSPRLHHFTVEP